jgi:hypothetical protein
MPRPEAVEVNEILSLWRSPLDKVALAKAEALADRQPCCSIGLDENFSAMTVYNYGFYVSQSGATPETALIAMLAAMDPNSQGAIGGVAFIPQQTFTMDDASFFPFSVPDQCNIFSSGTGGSGGSPPYYHFLIEVTDGVTFLSCSGSTYTTGGTYFHGLAFRWDGSSNVGDTCILAATGNCCAIRCTFTDCPQAFYAQAPGCALKQCTINYRSTPDGATAVVIASSQCAILGPGEFQQQPPFPGGGGPQNCTCISMQGGADHTVIADTHVSEWWTGVDFSQGGGSTNTHIRNCQLQCYVSPLNIQLNSAGGPIVGVKVTGSTLTRTNESGDSGNPAPVVLIDPNGNGNGLLSDITLLGRTVWNTGDASALTGQHGLKIIGGTNIKIIGGRSSCT